MVVVLLEAKIYKFKSCTQIHFWTAPLFTGTNSTYGIVWLFGSEMGNDLDGFLAFWLSGFLDFWISGFLDFWLLLYSEVVRC